MYKLYWVACKCNGSECVETLDEAKERFASIKTVFGAYRYEVRLRATNELVLKG
jgi:hypothetical protein